MVKGMIILMNYLYHMNQRKKAINNMLLGVAIGSVATYLIINYLNNRITLSDEDYYDYSVDGGDPDINIAPNSKVFQENEEKFSGGEGYIVVQPLDDNNKTNLSTTKSDNVETI